METLRLVLKLTTHNSNGRYLRFRIGHQRVMKRVVICWLKQPHSLGVSQQVRQAIGMRAVAVALVRHCRANRAAAEARAAEARAAEAKVAEARAAEAKVALARVALITTPFILVGITQQRFVLIFTS